MSGEVHHLTRRGTKKSLFVRPIATTTRPDELKMEFSKFGAVRDVHIPGKKDRESGLLDFVSKKFLNSWILFPDFFQIFSEF